MANLQIIKDLAEERKLTLDTLAEKAGISVQTIHLMVRKNSTKIETLERIAAALQVPISEFFPDDPYAVKPTSVNIEAEASGRGAQASVFGDVSSGADPLMAERVRHLEEQLRDRDNRIADLRDMIAILRER